MVKGGKFLLVSSVAFVLGILGPAHARPLDPISPVEQAVRLAELQHMPWNGEVSEKSTEQTNTCIRSAVTLPVIDPFTGVNRKITISQSRPAKKLKSPFVIIVPTIEGVTSLEPSIASSFCSSGIASAITEVNPVGFPSEVPSWNYEDITNRWAVLALRTVLDYASANPNFDGANMGIIGLSLGGITSAMLAGIEPQRLKAVVIAVGGGNMPYVLANSDNKKVADFRRRRMRADKMKDVREYEEKLRQTVKYDAMYFASNTIRDNILMIIAKNDTKVPTVVQQELYEAFQRPAMELYSGGHVDTLVKMTFWYFDNVVSFFHQRFGMRVEQYLADHVQSDFVSYPAGFGLKGQEVLR